MITEERVEGPTPAGGAYAIAMFMKANGTPCVKEHAEQMEITEYDKSGKVLMRTYGTIGGAPL